MKTNLNAIAMLLLSMSAVYVSGCSGSSHAGPSAPGEVAAKTNELWRDSEGLAQPECAYYDAASDAVFVSNVNGNPKEKDGNGYITKLTTDGKVVAAKWATGLDAPKGLRSHGKTLWAADIDQIVAIDIESGKITERVAVEGATFLNDLATAADGTVYVADTLGNKIFRYQNGEVSTFGDDLELESPNGLLVDGDRLIVAAWGIEPGADFTTKTPGNLYWIDIKSGKKNLITKEPLGNLDGVELDGQGNYVVTEFMKGQVLRIDSEGNVSELMRLPSPGLADHAYLPGKQLLVQPHMMGGFVVGVKLAP